MSDESIDSLHFSVVREDLRREKIKIKLWKQGNQDQKYRSDERNKNTDFFEYLELEKIHAETSSIILKLL